MSSRSVGASIAGRALLLLTIAAFLLHSPGLSRRKAAVDQMAGLLPPGAQDYGQEYARKFSKRFDRLVSDSPMNMASREEPPDEVLDTPNMAADALALPPPSYAMDLWEAPSAEDAPLPGDPQLGESPGPDLESASGQPAGPFTLAFAPRGFLYGGIEIAGSPPVIIIPPVPPSDVLPLRAPGGSSPNIPPTTGRPTPDPGPGPGPDPVPPSVPEPSTWLLVGAGTLGLLWLAHSSRRRSQSRNSLQ
jgi:hypothetical protein